jgi:uncharacterized protein YbjT (DUF2867 family)
VLFRSALLEVERRRWAPAAEALRRALRSLQAVGSPLEEGVAMGHLGACRWADGELADAVHWLDRALPCTAPARVPGLRAWRAFVAGAPIDGPFDPEDPVPALLAGHPVPAEAVARSFDARLAAWARDHRA